MTIPSITPMELFGYLFIGLVFLTVVGFLLGYVLTLSIGLANMTLRKLPTVSESFFRYFGTPSSKKLELDWGLKQFFALFNKQMSERWYEARAHTYQGVWISLLCAFNIVTIVRFEFESKKDDCRYYTKIKTWKWTLSFKSGQEKMKFLLSEVDNVRPHMPIDAGCLYQIFVAGDNVVWDYVNGCLHCNWKSEDDES